MHRPLGHWHHPSPQATRGLHALAWAFALLVSPPIAAQSRVDHVAMCNRGDPHVAIKSCSVLLQVVPDAPVPLVRRARAYAAIGQHDKALSDYTQYLVRKPRDADVLYERANVHLERLAYRQAVDDFSAAIALRANWAAALNGRAWARFHLREIDAAMVDVEAALLIQQDNVAALDTRGHLYEHRGERDKAIADYRRALQLNPTHPLAYLTREGLRRLDAAP